MKIKEGFIIKNIGDHDIVVPVGERAIDLNGIMTLNKTARVLFEKLQEETSYQALVETMLDIYDISEEIVKKDIDKFIDTLKERNLLEI